MIGHTEFMLFAVCPGESLLKLLRLKCPANHPTRFRGSEKRLNTGERFTLIFKIGFDRLRTFAVIIQL